MTNVAGTKPAGKPRRWKRRLTIAVIVLAVLGLAARILLPLTLPTVLRKIASNYGFTCTYDRLELNLLSGDAGIWGVEVRPKEGGDPVLQAEYCNGNVSVRNLLRLRLDVWRLEADGVDINVDREADGSIPLLEKILGKSSTTTATPAATSNKPVDLSSPLKVDALRLNHTRVHLRDRSLKPTLDTVLAMDLRLSNLGSDSLPAKFEMNLACDPLLDSLQISGEGHSGGKTLDATIKVLARGIRLKPAAPYLEPLGIRPVADGITMRASGRVRTAPAPDNADGFAGAIIFDDVSATADQQEAFALDRVSLDATAIDNRSIHLSGLHLDGVRANAERTKDGRLRVMGLEWDPSLVARPSTQPLATAAAGSSRTTSAIPAPIAGIFAEPWSLAEITVKNFKATFRDLAMTPQTELSLASDQLSIKNIDHDPRKLDTTATLAGTLHAPGVVRDIELTGSAQPFAATKTFELKVSGAGLRPETLKPYLDQLGLESHLNDAAFTCNISGSLAIASSGELKAETKLQDISLRDGGDLLAFNGVSVADAALDPSTGKIRVGSIEISGPTTGLRRESDGTISALGLRTKPRVSAAAAPRTATTEPATAVAVADSPGFVVPKLPDVEIGRFTWKDIKLDLADDAASPKSAMTLSDLGVEVTNFRTVLSSSATQPAEPGHIRAWVSAPNIADRLAIDGSVTTSLSGLSLDVNVEGKRVTAAAIVPYLKPLGFEPVLQDGMLTAHATVDIAQTNDRLNASISADQVRYSDGDRELAAVDSLSVKNLSLHGSEMAVDAIDITRPRAAAVRDADGTFVAGGFRLLILSPSAAATIPPSVAVSAAVPTQPTTAPTASLFSLALNKLHVTDGSIEWTDRTVQPAVDTVATASVELDHVFLGRDNAEPATLNLTAKATGAADSITVTGTLLASPSTQSANLDITATGLRAGPLAAYVPAGAAVPLVDGRFHTRLDAAVSINPEGGRQARLIVSDLDYQDGDAPLLKVDSVKIIAPRIDLPDHALAIEEVSASGTETSAQRQADGSIKLLGVLIGAPNPPTTAPAAPVVSPVVSAPPPAAPVASASELVAAAHRPLPLVTVEKLDLGLKRLSLSDASRPESAPIVVTDLSLKNVNRIVWLGKDSASNPASHLRLTCRIDPLVDQVVVDAQLLPFVQQPNVQVDVLATGVRGEGLTALVPALKPNVDGSQLTDGRLAAHFESQMRFDRRTPLELNLDHGFDADILLSKVTYQAVVDGPVLAGVDEVRSEGIRIEPTASLVHVKSLEITKPIGLITADNAGIHALGWVVKFPGVTPTTGPTTEPASQPIMVQKETSPSVVAAAPAAPAEKPKGEVRIDQLLISGLDARLEDHTCDPPLIVPLNGLDVEVRDLSTLAPYQDEPIRFSAIVNAGKVSLAKHGQGGVANPQMEDRDLFAQVTANGSVSLYPKPTGWVKTSVSGFELAALEGEAKREDVSLRNGTYDSAVDARLKPDGSIELHSHYVFTDLAGISEGPEGPIGKVLHLPSSLDVVVVTVQDPAGSITLPVDAQVRADQKPSVAVITGVLLEATGSVIAIGFASAPVKVMQGAVSLIGIKAAKKGPEAPTDLAFKPGAVGVDAAQKQVLIPLLKRMRDDSNLTLTVRHELGGGDVQLASQRANPSPEDCRNMEYQLRGRKAELLRLRADAAGQARGQLVSLGVNGATATLARLRAIDAELGRTEDALDQVCELLRPGADRQAARRTRAASLQIARERLDAVKALLLAATDEKGKPIKDIAQRVNIVEAQFNPADDNVGGGHVLISAVVKK